MRSSQFCNVNKVLPEPFQKSVRPMSTHRRSILSVLALLTMVFSSPFAFAQQELSSMFNGRDLNGWVVPEDNIWYKADDGVLKIRSGPDEQGSILWTTDSYTNFIVELEFKMGAGTVDSGVFLRSDKEQIQIGISGSLKRDMTASPYIAGKGYPVEANGVAKLLDEDGWNEMTIVAKGPHYSVWLNGAFVMTYKSDSATKEGPLGLQLHGNRDMEIDYKNIRIAKLN